MGKSLWGVALAVAMAGTGAAKAEEGEFHVLIGGPETAVVATQAPADVMKELGDYWLGLECSQATGPVRTQLGLPEGQGLVVENLVPDSPAAKAGIERYDVLLKANDKPLANVLDLIKVINEAKGEKIDLELYHAAKKKMTTVMPAKRPADARVFTQPGMPNAADAEKLQKWMKEMMPLGEPGKPLRFQIFQPGQILPPGAFMPKEFQGKIHFSLTEVAELEDGYKATITRESDKPAKITVTKDKETWEATEGDLGKLPEKIRPKVELLLARAQMGANMFYARPPMGGAMGAGAMGFGTWPAPPPTGPTTQAAPQAPQTSEHPLRLERRLEQMSKQIEQLRKSVEELRQRDSSKKAPPEAKENKSEKHAEKGDRI